MKLYFLTSRIRLQKHNISGFNFNGLGAAIAVSTLFLLFACTKKSENKFKDETINQVTAGVAANIEISNETEKKIAAEAQKNKQYKTLAQAIRYMSGIEGETLKLLLGQYAPVTNPFAVLVKGLSIYTGGGYAGGGGEYLAGYDCQKIVTKEFSHKIEFFTDCQKPARKIAELTIDLADDKKFAILFLITEWSAIVGPVAKLGLDNRFCEFEIKDERLYYASCSNTIYANWTQQNSINYYDLRLKKYIFKRDNRDELVVEGGQYKDMIEIKKISLKVPVSGKIEIFEKELKVKDDFAEMQQKQMQNLNKTKGEFDDEEKNKNSNPEGSQSESNQQENSSPENNNPESNSESEGAKGYSR